MSAISFEAAPEAPSPAAPSGVAPTPGELLSAVLGFALLGLAAGLGSGDTGESVRAIPSGLLAGGGALVLTGPALVVAHQFLGLGGRPEALVAALGRGFTTAGTV